MHSNCNWHFCLKILEGKSISELSQAHRDFFFVNSLWISLTDMCYFQGLLADHHCYFICTYILILHKSSCELYLITTVDLTHKKFSADGIRWKFVTYDWPASNPEITIKMETGTYVHLGKSESPILSTLVNALLFRSTSIIANWKSMKTMFLWYLNTLTCRYIFQVKMITRMTTVVLRNYVMLSWCMSVLH